MNRKQVNANQTIPVSKLVKYSQIDIEAKPSQEMTSKSLRPVTSLKQRASTSQSSKELEQSVNTMLYNPYHNQQVPMTARNQDQQKFQFDEGEETKSNRVPYKEGRLTPIQQYRQQASKLPTNNNERGTSSTQLQRFINASKSATRQQSQTPAPEASQSVKATNLPPRAYQSRLENPGDKMTKAGESLSHSIISSSGGHHKSINHHNFSNHSQSQHSQSLMNIQSGIADNSVQQLNHIHQRSIGSSSSRIMQTGGTLNDADEEEEASPQQQKQQQEVQMVRKSRQQQDAQFYQINNGMISGNAGCSSGGSMSPVCEEEAKNADAKKKKKQ